MKRRRRRLSKAASFSDPKKGVRVTAPPFFMSERAGQAAWNIKPAPNTGF